MARALLSGDSLRYARLLIRTEGEIMRVSRYPWVIAGLVGVAAPAAFAQRGPGGGGPDQQGVAIKPGQECPPGTTEVRPGRCQAPATPPPSILDYRPKSTVVAEAHPVPKAKFPVVDIHSHQPATAGNMEEL